LHSGAVVVGFCGRLSPIKGLTYLLVAMKLVREVFPQAVLLLVGDGPERSRIQSLSKKLGIPTIITGWVRDTRPYYLLMDVLVLPSLSEGLPNVLLEGLALERSIVSTDVGGTRELIIDGITGFLVPPRNSVALAEKILLFLSDDKLRRKTGSLGRKFVLENYSWERSAKKLIELYQSLI